MRSGQVREAPIQEIMIWHEDCDSSKSSSSFSSSNKTDSPNDEKKPEIELNVNVIENLYYFHDINSTLRDELVKRYNQSLNALEKNIFEYKWFYRGFYALYTTAIATNFLECFFLIDTAKEGVKTFSNYFFGIEVVPDLLIYFVGIPWALTDLFVYMVVISAHVEAIKSTLDYILQPSLKNQIKQFISQLIQDPLKTVSQSSYRALNHFILLSCNLTESLSDIIAIKWFTNKPIQFYQWSIMSIILYLGNVFNSKFTNPDYREGLEFWKNKDKLPYLYEKILSGNFLIPLHIFIQGCCVVGLEAFPLSYYLSLEAEEQLGAWLPPYFAASLSVIHSLCVLYPATYFYYMENDIEFTDLIRSQFGHQIESDIRKKHSKNVTIFNDCEIKKEVDTELEKIKIHLKQEIAADKKYGYVFLHRPELLFSMIIYGLAGGFLGYLVLNPLFIMVANDITSSKVCATLIGSSLFSAGFYRIEKDIYNSKLAIEKMKYREQAGSEKESKIKSTCSSKCETILAITFNLGSSLLSFASIIGSEAKITSNSKLLPMVIFAGAQRMSNNIAFLKDKLENNVHNAVKTVHSFFKGSVCTFFYRKINNPISPEPIQNLSLNVVAVKK